MPAQIGSLYVSLTLDARPYSAGWSSARSATTQGVSSIASQVGIAQRSVDNFTKAAGNSNFRPYAILAATRGFETAADRASLLRASLLAATTVAGGFTAALAGNVIERYADSFINLTNQLKTVTSGTANLTYIQDQLVGVSERSRSSLQTTATIYARTARAAQTLGTSQQDLLRITETVQKAFAIGGATQEEAAGAALQLSQAIASNRFGGDEFRSVAENAPVLMQGIAKSLGVNLGQLRNMSKQGLLTSDVVTTAILKSSQSIDDAFNKTTITVDQALSQLDNKILLFIGSTNAGLGITRNLSAGILELGQNLNTIIPILVHAGAIIASAFVARGIVGRNTTVRSGIGAIIGAVAGNAIGGAGGGTIGAIIGGGLGFASSHGRKITQIGPDGVAIERQVGFLEAMKINAEAAKKQVSDLTEKAAALQDQIKELNATRNQTVSKVVTNPLSFAPKSSISEYQRESLTLQKLDEQRLALNDKIRDSYAKLADVTATLSPKAIKLSDAQYASEQRLNSLTQQRATLQQAEIQATTKETAALAKQATSTTFIGATADAVKERLLVEQKLQDTETAIGKETETLAQRTIAMSTAVSEAESKAGAKRIQVLNQIESLTKDVNALDEQRVTQAGQTETSRVAAETAGLTAGKAAIKDQTFQINAMGSALEETTVHLASAERAVSPVSRALGFMKEQGAQVIGLFGGPWGAALTGAGVIAAAMADQTLEAAQKIQTAKQIIAEATQKGLVPDLSVGSNAGSAQADQLDAQQKQINALKDGARQAIIEYEKLLGLHNTIGGSEDPLQSVVVEWNALQNLPIQGKINELQGLVSQFVQGKISVYDFTNQLHQMQTEANNSRFDYIAGQVLDLANTIAGAGPTLDKFNQQMADLNKAGTDKKSSLLGNTFDLLTQDSIKQGDSTYEVGGTGNGAGQGKLSTILQQTILLKNYDKAQRDSIATTKLGEAEQKRAADIQQYLDGMKKEGIDITSSAAKAEAAALADQKIAADTAKQGADDFAKALDDLKKKADDLALTKAESSLSDYQKGFADVAKSAGFTTDQILTFIKTQGLPLNLQPYSALLQKLQQLYDAYQAATGAAQTLAANETQYSVPNSSGGKSTVDVYRGTASPSSGSSGSSGGSSGTGQSSVWTLQNGQWVQSSFADGGHVVGPGSGTSDSIDARLSDGEFVVKARQTRKYRGLLEAINDNRLNAVPHFDAGGIVHKIVHVAAPADTSSSDTSSTTSVASTPEDPLYPGETDPGLIAFDKAHPTYKQDLAAAATVGGPGYNYYQSALVIMRNAAATNFHPISGVWSIQQANAFAWYAGQQGAQWPSALPGVSIGGVPYAQQTAWNFSGMKDGGLVGFSTGGAIMGGPDSQIVKFRKSPDESVAIFTPHQMDIVRDALNGNRANDNAGGATIHTGDMHFHIMSTDPQESSRAVEMRLRRLFTKWSNGRAG